MKYSYARVSTEDKNPALQLVALKKAGCKTVFKDEGISGATAQRTVYRARIVLLCVSGVSQELTAEQLGVNRPVVALWERRFRRDGLAELKDAKGRGRKSTLALQAIERVVAEKYVEQQWPLLGKTS